MRILFWGGIENNVGPDNINKGIVANLSENFLYVTTSGRYREMIEGFWKLLRADVVVISCVGKKHCCMVAAAKLLGKRSIYLMHGSYEHECEIEGIEPDKTSVSQANFLLKNVDLILPVSKRYMEWAKTQYPQYAHKMDYVYNGVDATLYRQTEIAVKQQGSVAVAGGLQRRKNNIVVAEAVEALDGKARLRIYGGRKQSLPERYRHTERMGKLSNELFLDQLRNSSLFVLNSVQESFSIATMEALACGCSLLVSEVAGVCDLLALEETDIIHDPMDVEEVRRKIEYLLEHPNHERLRSQFDPEQWSFAKMVENLEKKCEQLIP